MTREDIVRMAREATAYACLQNPKSHEWDIMRDERFAALVAGAERKECAELCVKLAVGGGFAADCAEAIRVRGNSE